LNTFRVQEVRFYIVIVIVLCAVKACCVTFSLCYFVTVLLLKQNSQHLIKLVSFLVTSVIIINHNLPAEDPELSSLM